MPEESPDHGRMTIIEVQAIDPSPFQRRQHFEEDKLKGLAASIQRDGLIEPIVVRPNGGRYQLIAGERRWRAIRDYTEMETVQARIVNVNDLQARRMSAAENLQREDLSAIETIEAVVEIVDAELIEDKEYAVMGKTPADRVKTLLGKIDSVRRSRERSFNPAKETKQTSHKFVGRVEKIFKNLPKPLEWRSFFNHDLPLLMDFCEEVREVSIQHRLNRSQTRALAKLKDASEEEFQEIASIAPVPPKPKSGGEVHKASSNLNISDLSAREIEEIAKKAVRDKSRIEQNQPRKNPPLALEVKIPLMNRLGIPVNRIAMRLKVNRKTVLKYSDETPLLRTLRESLSTGYSIFETAQANACPESLVRSIALEGKSDQERFKSLGWGLRTWDHWYFNDIDRRFGDDWPGRIPAQLVGHALYYFTLEGNLVFDPMAGGGVVPDTCLAFRRKCWSFDIVDRPETRPEIEPFQWNPKNLQWPVKGKEKPDLIFLDPPYFKKMADQYVKESISGLSRKEYLSFFLKFFSLAKENSKANGRIAFLNADWRDFQGVSAMEENPARSICIDDYISLLKRAGWEITHIIDAPLSTQRFQPRMVSRMQKNRTLGVVRRSLIMGRKR